MIHKIKIVSLEPTARDVKSIYVETSLSVEAAIDALKHYTIYKLERSVTIIKKKAVAKTKAENTVFTLEEAAVKLPHVRILYDNISYRKSEKVVKVDSFYFQPFTCDVTEYKGRKYTFFDNLVVSPSDVIFPVFRAKNNFPYTYGEYIIQKEGMKYTLYRVFGHVYAVHSFEVASR